MDTNPETPFNIAGHDTVAAPIPDHSLPPSPDTVAAPIPEAAASGETNLLDDVEYILYQASGGKRFLNYLIDSLVFYLAWRLVVVYWFVSVLVWVNFPLGDTFLLYLVSFLGVSLFLGLIIAGFEAVTGGKTIGKYITGTRAVTDQGVRISPKKALLRFLVRQVPFEPLSALGSPSFPWHDRWTKTVVIDEKLTTLPPVD